MDRTVCLTIAVGLLAACGALLAHNGSEDSRLAAASCETRTVVRLSPGLQQCQPFVPTGAELAANATILPSRGAEEQVEGYSKSRCVTGLWAHRQELPLYTCLQRCSADPRCVGVLWGQELSPSGLHFNCLHAGAGDSPTIIEHACSPGLERCPPNATYKALADLAPTLSCWQRLLYRCPAAPCVTTESASAKLQKYTLKCRSVVRRALAAAAPHIRSAFATAAAMPRTVSAQFQKSSMDCLSNLRRGLVAVSRNVRQALAVASPMLERLLRFCSRVAKPNLVKLRLQSWLRPLKRRTQAMRHSGWLCLGAIAFAALPALCLIALLCRRSWSARQLQHMAAADATLDSTAPALAGDLLAGPLPLDLPPTPHRPPRPGVPPSAGVSPPRRLGGEGRRSATPQSRHVPVNKPPAPSAEPPLWQQLSTRMIGVRDFWAFVDDGPVADNPAQRTPLRQLSFDECSQGRVTANPRQSDLLDTLNTSDMSEIQSLAHMDENSAQQLLGYRERNGGELTCVSDLVTKVGLRRGTVTKFMREHGICN